MRAVCWCHMLAFHGVRAGGDAGWAQTMLDFRLSFSAVSSASLSSATFALAAICKEFQVRKQISEEALTRDSWEKYMYVLTRRSATCRNTMRDTQRMRTSADRLSKILSFLAVSVSILARSSRLALAKAGGGAAAAGFAAWPCEYTAR